MFVRFFHLVHIIHSFSFLYSLLWVRHLVVSSFLVVMNNAAVNIHVLVSWCTSACISIGFRPRNVIAKSQVIDISSALKDCCPKVFQSTQTSLHSYLKWYCCSFLHVSCVVVLWTSKNCGLTVFSIFGNLLATISSNIFLSQPSPLRAPITHILGQLKLSQLPDALLMFFNSFFPLYIILDIFYCYVFKFTDLFFCSVYSTINNKVPVYFSLHTL